jgi:hypothetical protein
MYLRIISNCTKLKTSTSIYFRADIIWPIIVYEIFIYIIEFMCTIFSRLKNYILNFLIIYILKN